MRSLLPKVQEILKQNMENRGVGREGSPIASEKQGPRCLSPDDGGAALYIVIWIFSTESIFRHCGPPKLFARALLARRAYLSARKKQCQRNQLATDKLFVRRPNPDTAFLPVGADLLELMAMYAEFQWGSHARKERSEKRKLSYGSDAQ